MTSKKKTRRDSPTIQSGSELALLKYNLSSRWEHFHNEFQSLSDRVRRLEEALDARRGENCKARENTVPQGLSQSDSLATPIGYFCQQCCSRTPQIHSH